ncbi:argininosuccinate lyase isoform X2 [Amblyomma americanum]
METKKLWGGRFSGKTSDTMLKFNNSVHFDQRLWKEDLEGSMAYAKALQRAGIVSQQEAEAICRGLSEMENEWHAEAFHISQDDEDIHSANERRLKEIVGHKMGGKLHTGRSRNDQVATDLRLWTRKSVATLIDLIKHFVEITCARAESEIDVLMPGYTHLQRAQPIRLSHWMLSYAWFLKQDAERFRDLSRRLNVCPLGSGALAGNPFPIDKEALASDLQFGGVIQNSITAVSDRDFVAEFLFVCSLTAVHLSKLAEDLILYSSAEFGYVTIDEAYSTGSSLMPQKKNPDGLELIRGKTGRISGDEDKEAIFDAYDTLAAALEVAAGNVETMKVKRAGCESALSPDMLATDVAYYLVRKGTPFRDAHHIAGKLVTLAEQKKVPMTALSCSDAKSVSGLFGEDLAEVWNYEHSVEQYKATGGTARQSVQAQIASLREWLTSGH